MYTYVQVLRGAEQMMKEKRIHTMVVEVVPQSWNNNSNSSGIDEKQFEIFYRMATVYGYVFKCATNQDAQHNRQPSMTDMKQFRQDLIDIGCLDYEITLTT